MARGRKVRLETRTFDKFGDAQAFFKEILNRYPIGGLVIGTDKADLRALLKRHSEEAEKVGCGVDHFVVDNGPPGHDIATRCFWIVRTDGSRIDFSYGHCLEARPEDAGP